MTVATSLQMRVVALPLGLPWPGCSVTNTGSIILLAWYAAYLRFFCKIYSLNRSFVGSHVPPSQVSVLVPTPLRIVIEVKSPTVIFFILTMLKSVNRFYPRRKRSGVSPFRVFSPIRRTVVTDGTVFFFMCVNSLPIDFLPLVTHLLDSIFGVLHFVCS